MKVLVVFHSVYGHVHALANAVAAGVQEVPGIELVLRRVREFPENVQHMEQEKGYRTSILENAAVFRILSESCFRSKFGHLAEKVAMSDT